MCIFRIGVLIDRKKLFNLAIDIGYGLGFDEDNILYCPGNKDYYIDIIHGEFRRIDYPQQYLTLSSKRWVKMIQKDYGLTVTGEIDFYTYNAIMSVYGDDKLEAEELYQSFMVIRASGVRKAMHKYYMKQTLERIFKIKRKYS